MDSASPAIERLKAHVVRALWFALALIFLVESWIWDHVKDWLRQLEIALGLERFERWLEGVVARLSPQMTLGLFAIPAVAVLPLKIIPLALLAHGHVFWGLVVIFLVKSLTLGVEAFLFDICREKLLEMPWFARLYSIVLDLRAWATLFVKPYKARAGEILRDVKNAAISVFGDNGGELARRISRLRDLTKSRRS